MRGGDAGPWVDERIDALLRKGELKRAERFRQIAERLVLLRRRGRLH